MMFCRRVFMILFIFLVPQQSDSSLKDFFQKLDHTHQSNKQLTQVSDFSSSSPAPSIVPQLGSSSVENCDASVSYQCHDDSNKFIACLPAAAHGSRGSTLLLRNDGETDLKLNVSLFPVNYTYNNVHIPRHEVYKINISSNIRECSSVRVSGEDGECIILLGVVAPLEKLYKGYANLVNAAYILFGTVVLIAGMWACYKFRNKARHLDGVPYKELEMEHQKQPLPYVQSADNWDESWDDDWDEEQAVRSPGGNHPQSRLSNGAS